jgi:hypothetical protein
MLPPTAVGQVASRTYLDLVDRARLARKPFVFAVQAPKEILSLKCKKNNRNFLGL